MSCPENCGHSGCVVDGLYERITKLTNELKIADAERYYQRGMIEEYRKDLEISRNDLKATQYWLFASFGVSLIIMISHMM